MRLVNWSRVCGYTEVNGLYVLKNAVWMEFEYSGTRFRLRVDAGSMTDGLSVPRIFRWYLPAWDDRNILYNVSGICHDGAYGSELLSKPVADELFYLGLVTSGVPRYKARTALWAVEYLAGLHYGRRNDDYGISEYVSLEAV